MQDAARKKPVARKGESVDLDLRLLSFPDKADVPVRNHGLDFGLAIGWHHHEKRLPGRNNAADRVNRALLHRPRYGSHEMLKPSLLLRFGNVLAKARGLASGLGQVSRERPLEFGRRVVARLGDGGDRGLGLLQVGALDLELFLLLDELA